MTAPATSLAGALAAAAALSLSGLDQADAQQSRQPRD